MNKVFLIGRLTKDPELRYTGNNTPVASFTLAVNRTFSNSQGEREADFINVVVWRKQAENVKNYLHQGYQAAVDGRIQTRSYDAQDGSKRYVTEVIADNVEFLAAKKDSANTNNVDVQPNTNINEPTPYDFKDDNNNNQTGTDVDENPFADFASNIEVNDNDLPF